MLKACEGWAELLSAYLDNETTPEENARVERHLQSCAACRAGVEMMRCDAQDTVAALQGRGAGKAFAAKVILAINPAPNGATANPTETAGTAAPTPALPPTDRYTEVRIEPKRKPSSFGWVGWLVTGAFCLLIAGAIFPVFGRAREKSRSTTCLNNARQIAVAFQMYVQDNNNRYPGANWLEVMRAYDLSPNVGSTSILNCPTVTGNAVEYVYNPELYGKLLEEIADPTTTPLLWCIGSHNGMRVVAYVDGHVEMVPLEDEEEDATDAGQSSSDSPTADTPVPVELTHAAPTPTTPTIAPPTKNYGLNEKVRIGYSASVGLECVNVSSTTARTELLFRQYGGFVLSSLFQRETEHAPATATITGRVPTERLGELLLALDRMGNVVSRTVNGEDLTPKYIETREAVRRLYTTQTGGSSSGTTTDTSTPYATPAPDPVATRTQNYQVKSRLALAEVTVKLDGLRLPTPTPTEYPVAVSAGKALTGLKLFGIWLLSLLIPLLIWSPVWGSLLFVGILLKRRYWAS